MAILPSPSSSSFLLKFPVSPHWFSAASARERERARDQAIRQARAREATLAPTVCFTLDVACSCCRAVTLSSSFVNVSSRLVTMEFLVFNSSSLCSTATACSCSPPQFSSCYSDLRRSTLILVVYVNIYCPDSCYNYFYRHSFHIS